MSVEIDILALEPFYGGPRKAMLETLTRCSRHRWTVLKLPPRRIERRLVAAAHWFGEQLSLHWPGKVDLVFCSEAINLADLYRLVPGLGGKPSVVYFHDNQLPQLSPDDDLTLPSAPTAMANLSTAQTAYDLWFNSTFHHRLFFNRVRSYLQRQNQNFTKNPLEELIRKSHLMPPPVSFTHIEEIVASGPVQREPRTLFVDTRNADFGILNEAFATLQDREEPFELITVGPLKGLADQWPMTSVPETDETAVIQAMRQCGAYINARMGALWDDHILTALAAGCWPIVPMDGIYMELIPKLLEERCLYDNTGGGLAFTIQDFWELILPNDHELARQSILDPFAEMGATMAMDNRLEEVAIAAQAAAQPQVAAKPPVL